MNRWMTHAALARANMAGLCLALAACAPVGPDYVTPALRHPDAWSASLPVPAASRDEIDPVHWWRAFQDPVLDRLVALALARNQDLAIARERLLQARAERDQLASRLGPDIGLGGEAAASRSARALTYPPGIGETRTYRLGLDASWELDVFGGNRRALEAADAWAQAEAETARALRVSLLAELASSYVALRSARERQGIARDTVQALAVAQGLAERSYRRGLGTAVEVAQARAERELAEASLPALREDEARLAHAIGVLTGGFPGDLRDALARGPASTPAPPPLPASLPSTLLRSRPDIRAAERRLAAATAQAGVAAAERFPRFAIPLSLGSAASLIGDLFSRASATWSLGAGVSQSLYDGGRASAGLRAAEAGVRAQRLAYERSLRGAFQDVEDALAGLNAERERQASLSAAVRDSAIAEERATRLYRNGLLGYLPVLVAQRATHQARDALALNALARSQHAIGLYKALGAGWEPEEPDSAGSATPPGDHHDTQSR